MKKKAAIITCFFFLFSIANAGFTNLNLPVSRLKGDIGKANTSL